MGTYSPPSYYFSGIGFNPAFYQSSTLTNALYLKRTGDTSTGLQIFSAGASTNTLTSTIPSSTVNLYTTSTGYVTLGGATNLLSIVNAQLTLNTVNLSQQTTSLASWNGVSSNIGLPSVASSIQCLGYAITPTLGAIAFYPQANAPIVISVPAVYNVQATFQFTFSSINTTGRIRCGVSTSSATGDWLYGSNGNFNNNIFSNHVGSISSGDSPIVYSVNFTASLTGNLYLKYEIQAGSYTGSLIVNYQITRVG